MATARRSRSALLALDGPSALALYRKRDAENDLKLYDDSCEPDGLGIFDDELNNMDNEDFWLSDEDVAAIMDDPSVFEHSANDAHDSTETPSSAEDDESPSALPTLNRTRIQDFTHGTSLVRNLKQIPFEELGVDRPSPEQPLYLMVARKEARRKAAGVHVRTCANVPNNALRRLGRHVLVPTPEFTFLLLSKYLNICDLIRVGMELCGHYRHTGASTSDLLASRGTLYGQQAHTTAERLRAFVEAAEGFPGSCRALRACRYIVNHSASPMETTLYLLLCLPVSMGGYALPRPVLNAKRKVSGRAEALTFSRNLIPDLYWASAHLDMEYDSEEFHANPQSLKKGARRTLALRAMSVEVVSMTGDIVRDQEAFDAVVRLVARTLHARVRKPSKKALKARKTLRNSLLCFSEPQDA